MRRIAVLTSGGDAPGMNAAVRAVVRSADAAGVGTYGVQDGYAGLIEGRLHPLDARAVSGILHQGGTMLGTARSPAFRTSEGRRQAAKHLHLADIEGLVVIGGDGSFRGADALSREGHVRVVGIPGTIDNDLSGTDFTLGFDTAVNTALELIDRIRDTAASHGRLFFVEVMGRRSGWLALYAGLAGGGTEILVPERPTDAARVRERVRASFALGKRFCLVIVAEGDDAGGAYALAERVSEGLDVDYRVTALGHVQRGGSPTMRDRVLAGVLGDAAVTALCEGADRVMVGERRGELIRSPLEQTWTRVDRTPEHLLTLMDRLAR
ncbi:MAG TPA: 6-phosphofructokinase [Egibacteraceae bacterium]|jgi:6-phosphofructokinase 1|nr:6-phosphofructokinase [Egibacteraceae bacterium]